MERNKLIEAKLHEMSHFLIAGVFERKSNLRLGL